jgi:hypothetical protein
LRNVVERSVIVSQGPELRIAMLEVNVEPAPAALPGRALKVAEEAERARILLALDEAHPHCEPDPRCSDN